MTAPADSRISDEDVDALLSAVPKRTVNGKLEVQHGATMIIQATLVDAALTELRERRAQAVTVKPLEWDDSNEHGVQISSVSKRRIMERARHSFGAYFLEQSQDDDSWWAMKGLLGAEIDGPFEHDWQARAAVQAYYDERIIAAVYAAPPPAAGVTEEMVQRFIETSSDETAGYTCWSDAVRAGLEAVLEAPLTAVEHTPQERVIERAAEAVWDTLIDAICDSPSAAPSLSAQDRGE